jgi:hypothetical protein
MSSPVPTIHDPALAWLAAQLRWEHRLEALRRRHAVEAGPRREQKRPAA